MTAVDGVDAILVSKCMAFCQALASQGQAFNFSLAIGPTFSFSLDTRSKELEGPVAKKGTSPSTQRRNAKRRKGFFNKKHRPVRWSFFRSDGMVNVFFQGTISINGFSMVLPALNYHHLMFFDQPTIAFNGFSMVFRFYSTMIDDGLETPKLQKVRKFNSQKNVFSQNR